ncbi:MAG: hypothetical protein ACI4PX_01435 [Ruminococcus sp.]
MLSTKDEIEKMLDEIQKSKPADSTKKSKSKYNDMSLDDLLNTISPKSEKKKEVSVAENIIEKTEKFSEEISEEPENISESVPEPVPESELIPESIPEPEPVPESEPVPELISEPESEPESIPESVPQYEPEEIPFRSIFDESPREIEEEKKETPEPDEYEDSSEETIRKNPKKTLNTVVGAVLLVFSVIGIISTFSYAIKHIRSFTEGESKQSEFADAVYPAVIMDIEAFQNGSELSSQQVITASVWKLIMSGEIDKYEHTFDIISVPAVDIEAEAVKLFDTEFPNLEHQTVGSGELKFYYNEDTGTYNIPSKPMLFSYKPRITALSRDGDIYTAEVEYIQEKPYWMENNSKYNSEVSKVVKFRLKPSGDDYAIISMEIIKLNQTD